MRRLAARSPIYFSTQPTELRFAVGPPNSEDTRVVQAIAAQFARDQPTSGCISRSSTAAPPAAAAAIDKGQADLAVVRRDSGMPKDGQAVAILRKNVVVFIVPSAAEPAKAAKAAKGKAKSAKATPKAKKEPIDKIEDLVGKRLGVVGRIAEQHRAAQGDPAAIQHRRPTRS